MQCITSTIHLKPLILQTLDLNAAVRLTVQRFNKG